MGINSKEPKITTHSESTKIIAGRKKLGRHHPTNIEIEKIFKHESYCLAKVSDLEIDGDFTEEVCLADSIEDMSNEECYTAGWNDEHNQLSSKRRRSSMKNLMNYLKYNLKFKTSTGLN